MKSVFFFLLSHFAVGLLFTILFIRREEIGKLFFRVTSLIALSLIVFALAAKPFGRIDLWAVLQWPGTINSQFPQLTYFFFLTTALLLLLYNLFGLRFHKQFLLLSVSAGILGVTAFSLTTLSVEGKGGFLLAGLFIANGLGATLVLGAVLGAMITGHWYLVQHKLSLDPLKNSSKVYLTAVIFRFVIIVLAVLSFWNTGEGSALIASIISFNSKGLIFLGRIIFGLIVPFVFGIMVWKSTLIRSTQSATGILYATIVLVLVGETFARFLYFLVGIPL